jgi:CRISP-associated protein Cas1
MQIITEGYDTTVGDLHSCSEDRPALIFDLMEPLRPGVDRKAPEFVQSHTFHPADFTIRSDGVCMHNPKMARHLVRITLGCLQQTREGRLSNL